MSAFTWGDNGQAITPDEAKRRREVALAMIQSGTANKPIQHWTQGAANVAQALMGGYDMRQIDQQERAAREASQKGGNEFLSGMMGGTQTPSSGMTAPQGGGQRDSSTGTFDSSVATPFLDTLRSGGITNPNALAAVGATGQRESGWDPKNLNRSWSDPSESGAAGQAGGALSWRAERLDKLRAFAAANGEQGNGSPATQAKFFMQEDPALVARLNAAKSPEEAMQHMNGAWRFAGYDRPGGEAAARMAEAQRWVGRVGQGGNPLANVPPMQTGAARDAPDAVASQQIDPARAIADSPIPQRQAPVQVAQAGGVPSMPQQPSLSQQAGQAMLGKAMKVMNDPYAPAGSKAAAQAYIQKSIAQETKDPRDVRLKDLSIQKAEGELQNAPLTRRQMELANKKAERDLENKPNIEIIRDAATGEIIAVDKNNIGSGVQKLREGGPSKDAPTTKNIKQPDGSEVAVQWNPQSRAWEPLKAPEGGNAVKAPGKLTEQQSKDLVYYDRGSQALAMLDEIGADALASTSDSLASKVPIVGNMMVSEKFQQAKQAGTNFLASILRKDSGAAITTNEEEIYGRVFLPQPGDGPAVLTQKTAARRQAMDAIRNGLGPAEVLAIGSRLTKREDAKTPRPDGASPAQAPTQPSQTGKVLRYNPQTGALE